MKRWLVLLALVSAAATSACSDPSSFPPEDVADGAVEEAADDATIEDVADAADDSPDVATDAQPQRDRETTDAPGDVSLDVAPDDAALDVTRDVGIDAPEVGVDVAPDARADAGFDAPGDVPRDAGTETSVDVARPDGSRGCVTNADCEDGLMCTEDTCRSGVCSRIPNPDRCAANENCVPGAGCVAGTACTSSSACIDSNMCTDFEFCSSRGVCLFDILDDDADGHPPAECGGNDCDDTRSSVFPGATERCDGLDNNCNGVVDEETTTALCPGGMCSGGRCVCAGSSMLLCSGRCVDGMTDVNNCGRCGNFCPTGSSCVAGTCACGGSLTACGSRCVNLQTDLNNCGRCSNFCDLSATCVGGMCQCAAGRTSCASRCVDLQSDASNCGACGARCRIDQSCRGGTCQCLTGTTSCGAACANLLTDVMNCGACGTVCPAASAGAACLAGRCGCRAGVLCGSGATARCVDTTSDPMNCGACGTACGGGRECVSGRCVCPTALTTVCGDRCVDTQSEPAHCGACGRLCPAHATQTATCARGTCGVVCASGRGDCDGNAANGCETDVRTSSANCGTCGRQCPGGGACMLGACPGEDWARAVGGTSDDRVFAVAASPAGDVFVTGEFGSTVTLGGASVTSAGLADVFVAAFDPAGNPRWIRRIGSASADRSQSLAVDRMGNVYVSGSVSGSADLGGGTAVAGGTSRALFVSSFTSSGAFRWGRRAGDSFEADAYGVSLDASGNVYVTGTFAGRADFGGGALDAGTGIAGLIASFDGAGTFRWALHATGTRVNFWDVDFDASGNGVIVGHFTNTATVRTTALTSAGTYDVLGVGITTAGAVRWARSWGSTGDDLAFRVAVDSAGDAYATGRFDSSSLTFGRDTLNNGGSFSTEAYVVSLASTGEPRWARRFGSGADDDGGTAVAVDAARNVHVVGWFFDTADFGGTNLTSAGSQDSFLVSMGSDGTVRRARRFGGTRDDVLVGVSTLGSSVLVGGYFSGSMPVGSTSLTSAGLLDGFVARLAP